MKGEEERREGGEEHGGGGLLKPRGINSWNHSFRGYDSLKILIDKYFDLQNTVYFKGFSPCRV